MIKLNANTVERVSKKGSTYTFTHLKLYCPRCNAYVEIDDYSSPLPVGIQLKDLDVNIEERVVNGVKFLVISELNYTINYKYYLAINLLNNHKC